MLAVGIALVSPSLTVAETVYADMLIFATGSAVSTGLNKSSKSTLGNSSDAAGVNSKSTLDSDGSE